MSVQPLDKHILRLRLSKIEALYDIRFAFIPQEEIGLFLFDALNADHHANAVAELDGIFDQIAIELAA